MGRRNRRKTKEGRDAADIGGVAKQVVTILFDSDRL